MLVLDRQEGESIMIGDNIEVKFFSFHYHGSKPSIKIGIEAPREINIVRTELLEPGQANPYAVHGPNT